MTKRFSPLISVFVFFCVLVLSHPSWAKDESRSLIGSLPLIPGLIDSPNEGAFVDLIKALSPHTGGEITIGVFPLYRAAHNVIEGKADFKIPSIRNADKETARLPFRFISEKFGEVSFVIYSNIEKPITKKMIQDALKKNEAFPYAFEGPANSGNPFDVPVPPSRDVALSLQKVQKGRIDGFIWAQEEADKIIEEQKLNKIHRAHWADFDDTIIVAKTPRGDKADAILSDAIQKFRATGQLKKYYEKIHLPYREWQPAQMAWPEQP